jgi:outer membrane protein OmpA-like peptidoglycan-associated protein
MKWRVWRTVFATVAVCGMLTPAFSQNYYLVIGAFATEKDDIKEVTSYLPVVSRDTSYTLHANNDLLHLYVLKTSSAEMMMAKAQKLQLEMEKKDGQHFSSAGELNLTAEIPPVASTIMPEAEVKASASSNATGEELPSSGGIPSKPRSRFYKFTVSTIDGNRLPAEVHAIDMRQGRELKTYSSDTYVDLLRPGRNQDMALVCGVFGYKEEEKYVDYTNPALVDGVYLDDEGAWVIPYTLKRVEKGDVSVMYNVAYYKDAVVMLPMSKNDLDQLVDLMAGNPNYEIKVHAHCNGKHSRKIIALGENNNYFDVQGSIEKEGSAKELTNLRAEAIRTYLADHGIAKERVKILGWGGAEMLVDQNSPHAKLNDRIEIEILKD